MRKRGEEFRTIWQKPDDPSVVQIIDQRRLPHEYVVTDLVTWRDGAQLLTPLLVSLVLLVAPFEYFYLLLALILITAACAASYLPRRI